MPIVAAWLPLEALGTGPVPLPTSPAIDAGNDAVCPRWDQLGQRRVDIPGVGTSRCDIGAIEFQPRDTTPPAILVTATPETLWPPNGQLVPITITGTITDVGSGVDPDTAVFAVMDAYGSPQPRDHITLGKDGSYTCTLHLQASRKGNDTNGRQYTIRPYRREAATRPHFGKLYFPFPFGTSNLAQKWSINCASRLQSMEKRPVLLKSGNLG
jgi:hypothetical protein